MNKRTATFDHKAPVTEARFLKKKYLLQDDKPFTYAEYNRFTEKWEPEPKPLDMNVLYREAFRDQIRALYGKLSAVDEELKEMIGLLRHIGQEEQDGKKKG